LSHKSLKNTTFYSLLCIFALTMLRQNRFIHSLVFFFGFIVLAVACIDSEALRGKISVSLTDAPIDNDDIRKVNIAIRRVEVLPEGSTSWQTIKSFEEPRVVNLLEFTQGDLYNLTEQFLSPGDYEGIRLELNIANVSNGLTVFPQSNIVFADGTQETLFVDGTTSNYVETMVHFSITTNQTTFLVLDFDMRKSIVVVDGEYKLRPFMRVTNQLTSGDIDGQFRDFVAFTKVAVYAYKSGTLTLAETNGAEPFSNAVSGSIVRNSIGGRFYIAFLPADTYDLLFVHLNEDGSVNEVLGKQKDVVVISRETVFTCAQIDAPAVEGNCKQIEPL